MNVYKLIVSSDNFITNYSIKANNLKEASLKAKARFANQYREFNVRVGLDPTDFSNHINEIFEKFMEV